MEYINFLTRLFFALSSCLIISCDRKPVQISYPLDRDVYLAHTVQKNTKLQLQNELGLRLIGTGAQMMDEIQMLALSFEYDKPISACEGRKLLVRAVDIFLATINANEEIRQYLVHYPFEPENVEIRIFLYNSDRSEIHPGNLSVISAIEGVLKYKIEHPTTTRLVTAYRETYQEAVDKLIVNSTEPQQLVVPPPQNLFDRLGTDSTTL